MSAIHTLRTEAARLRRPILLAPRFSTWAALRRQRARLARLDAEALADIGLTRADAQSEARLPFWDVPPGWRR